MNGKLPLTLIMVRLVLWSWNVLYLDHGSSCTLIMERPVPWSWYILYLDHGKSCTLISKRHVTWSWHVLYLDCHHGEKLRKINAASSILVNLGFTSYWKCYFPFCSMCRHFRLLSICLFVCRLVFLLVCHRFLKGREVTFSCSYRRTCCFPYLFQSFYI